MAHELTDALHVKLVLGQKQIARGLGLRSVADKDRHNVRRVRNDRNTNRLEAVLDFGDVALLLLAVTKMLALVLDGGTRAGDRARWQRGGLQETG